MTYAYTYDDNGNILSVSDGTNTTSYAYDSANQLIRENNQAANKTYTWAYDNAGNILSKSTYAYTTGELGSASYATGYTYGDSAWGDLLTEYGGSTITYDAIGNPTRDHYDNRYTWKHGRQLATYKEDGNESEDIFHFVYNADGLRVKAYNAYTTYSYIYNGSALVQMEVSNTSTGVVSNTLSFTYDAQGSPQTVTYNGTVYFYATNLQGDVIAILDNTGTAVVSYSYDAWGRHTSGDYGTGTLASTLGKYNPLRYRGYIYDIESGLYYLQSRYYNPEMGRFINADGYTATGQGILGNNMFAYCGNNPIARKDDGGEWWHWVVGAVVGAVAGIVGQVISDVVTSVMNGEVTISNWQTYTGAAVGGAAGGVVLAITGDMNAANAVTGSVTTGVGQSLEKLTIKDYNKSWAEIGANTIADGVISYELGKLPGIRGVTEGRNSWSAVYKSGLTKLRNGTATKMSAKVIAKGLGSSIVGGFALDGYYGVKQHAYDRVKGLFD